MLHDVTVACVLRSGGDYDLEYVERLGEGVLLNGDPDNFVCLTDVPAVSRYCETVPLERDWPGWWSKVELFRAFRGPTVYFDLDTVIVGDLTDVLLQSKRAPITLLSDFYRPAALQSGVMAWNGDWSRIYEFFTERTAFLMDFHRRADRWGDGGYIGSQVPGARRWQDVLPGQVVSRKVKATRNANERVVCFHGRPRPREVDWQA